MKKRIALVSALLICVALAACGGNSFRAETKGANLSLADTQAKSEVQTEKPAKAKKVLVVYYSRSGNTGELASQIQKIVGGDAFEIQTVDPYPRDYDAIVKQAKQEIESGYKPALKTKVGNIKAYDVIFVGSPIWWGTIAPPVASFLTTHDLSGKTIVPFVTHGGSGQARSVTDIAKLCPQSTVLAGIAVSGKDVKDSQDELSKWLRDIGILK